MPELGCGRAACDGGTNIIQQTLATYKAKHSRAYSSRMTKIRSGRPSDLMVMTKSGGRFRASNFHFTGGAMIGGGSRRGSVFCKLITKGLSSSHFLISLLI